MDEIRDMIAATRGELAAMLGDLDTGEWDAPTLCAGWRVRLRHVLPESLTQRSVKFFGVDLDGIEFQASDMEWTLGSGEPLTGTAQDLLLAICGRKLPQGHLKGAHSERFTALSRLADRAAGGDLVEAPLEDRTGRELPRERVQRGGLVDHVRGVPALLLKAGPERLHVVRGREPGQLTDQHGCRGGMGIQPDERATAAARAVRIRVLTGTRFADVHKLALDAEIEVIVPVTLGGAGSGQKLHANPLCVLGVNHSTPRV